MSSQPPEFSYSNLSGRASGRLLRTAGLLLPGIMHVQNDVGPFARAWALANSAAVQADGRLWVALGDSLTQGIGAPSAERGWVGQVAERLAVAGHPHRVVNLAVSGARTADLLERQLPVLGELPADLVTVMIGSNDLVRPRNRRALAERFDRLLRQLPAGAIVTTLPNPSRTAREVNAVISRVAADSGLVVAELRDSRTTSWRGKLAADHFHPNERGYAAIADVIGDVVLRALEPGGAPSA